MSVAKVSEIIVSSPISFEDAIKVGVARAQKTLRNLIIFVIGIIALPADQAGR